LSTFYKLLFIILTCFFSSCHLNQQPMLIGEVSAQKIKESPFKEQWYDRFYLGHELNTDLALPLEGVEVEVFFGTWCGDSHKQVPAFMKIAHHYGIPFVLYGLNMEKTSEKKRELGKNIKRVPTFIVKKEGVEIGRIIETPLETIEQDLYKILHFIPYTSHYAE